MSKRPKSHDTPHPGENSTQTLPPPSHGADVHNMPIGPRARVRTYQGEPGATKTDRVVGAVLSVGGRVLWTHAVAESDEFGMSQAVMVFLFVVPVEVSDRWDDFVSAARDGYVLRGTP